jgi:putative lumazine-binding protein
MTKAATDLLTQAALDYFEGWYDADIVRMDRALHPDLVKRQAATLDRVTTKERMVELTGQGAGREDGADRRLEVEILDVHEDIASVVVRSAVYYEYVHLVRTPDGWQIANALWRFS